MGVHRLASEQSGRFPQCPQRHPKQVRGEAHQNLAVIQHYTAGKTLARNFFELAWYGYLTFDDDNLARADPVGFAAQLD